MIRPTLESEDEQALSIPGIHQTYEWRAFVRTNAAIHGDGLQSQRGWFVNGGLINVQVGVVESADGGWHTAVRLSPGHAETILPRIILREALDVLAVIFDAGFEIYPSPTKAQSSTQPEEGRNKPVVTSGDLHNALVIGSRLQQDESPLSRSFGWFRRGVSTQDEAMAYLGIWNALEVAASSYHTKTPRTQEGIKNQIYQAFLDLWSGKKRIPFAAGEADYAAWIDKHYEIRLGIAHGLIALTEKELRDLVRNLTTLRCVVREFLSSFLFTKMPLGGSTEMARLPNDF